MKFRKKPIIVDAVQITNDWFDGPHPNPLHPTDVVIYPPLREVWIATPKGSTKAVVGDWIVTCIEGEKYPCKASIFEKSYEAVEETQ